jgi:hypothetical protein
MAKSRTSKGFLKSTKEIKVGLIGSLIEAAEVAAGGFASGWGMNVLKEHVKNTTVQKLAGAFSATLGIAGNAVAKNGHLKHFALGFIPVGVNQLMLDYAPEPVVQAIRQNGVHGLNDTAETLSDAEINTIMKQYAQDTNIEVETNQFSGVIADRADAEESGNIMDLF